MATMKIEQRVENLARERVTSAVEVLNADVTYLSLLVDAMQAGMGKVRRGRYPKDAQLSVLESVHERFYAAVLRGVTTEDIAIEDGLDADEQRRRSLERNRRSAFARSAKSTVVAFITGGGDVRTLDPATVSKSALRKAVAPPEPQDRTARTLQRAHGMLLRAVQRRARGDPDAARAEVEELMDELQKILDSIGGEPEPPRDATTIVGMRPPDRGSQRTRVGQPLLHKGA